MPGFFLPYLWDATYILVIIGALLASANVNYTYKKYSRITAERPLLIFVPEKSFNGK